MRKIDIKPIVWQYMPRSTLQCMICKNHAEYFVHIVDGSILLKLPLCKECSEMPAEKIYIGLNS